MRSTLVARGFTVDTFTGTSGDTWGPALANADALVVPKLEFNPGVADNLDGPASAALDGFVRCGRRLVTFNDQNFQFMETFLNETPGSFKSGKSCPCARAGSAAGTEFEDGPLTLQAVSTTATLDVTTPVAATRAIYTDVGATAEAGVATLGVDAGESSTSAGTGPTGRARSRCSRTGSMS